jgi:DNA-binding NarL/FixJ family response regulator
MAMQHSQTSFESNGLASCGCAIVDDIRVLQLLPLITDARSTGEVLSLFRKAVMGLGADAGVFLSCLRDDATRTSLRSLWACDPSWAADYASHRWFEHDPWLRYASSDAEPARSGNLACSSTEENAFVRAAAEHGFASALIAPAPSTVGLSRVGVLCLGSADSDRFDGENYPQVRVLARALAMELHHWIAKSMREELLRGASLTEADLNLLRHEAAGYSSKVIGAAMNLEAKTIDCRFQRVNAKLGAPDRRTAVRIARLYGLL